MFQVPERSGRTYQFALGGETYELPALDALAMDELAGIADIIAKGRTDATAGDLVRAFIGIFDHYCPGIVGKLDRSQFEALVNDYLESSKADPGESLGSSD